MSRPLSAFSIDHLTEMAERNWQNEAELKLLRSELQHRSTTRAEKLKEMIDTWIRDCQRAKSKMPQSKPTSDISEQVRGWTNEAVAKLRAKLIDLSRKSPLISFKHASRSASQLRVVDERLDLLWTALNNGPMGFEPLPGEDQTPPDETSAQFSIAYEHARITDEIFQRVTEALGDSETDARAWQEAERALRTRVREQLGLPKLTYGKSLDVAAIARAHGFDPSFELKFSDDDGLADHHEDNRIRVLLTEKELEKRLKTILDRAGTHLRETGLHTLHLVFGFVQWFEDDASDIPMHAPLLLMPVALDREIKRGRYEYSLRATGDELDVNIALIEKASSHWGLQLPQLREEEGPESYFIRTKAVLEKGRNLKLCTFVTLAVLPPMVLWKDLDPASWSEDAFAKHRLLPGLIGAKDFSQTTGDAVKIDIDDPANAPRIPALITDADASQHHAIMDMAAGHDMAIEGPPGTGKSQTITNMIATALSQGKRVLFVAEKQAALRVVSDRLRAVGFGPLLLELHGERASRPEVYEGVHDRLSARPQIDTHRLEEKRAELRRNRDVLRRYLGLLRTHLGALQMTAHDLAWREIRLRSLFDREQIEDMRSRWRLDKPRELQRATLIEQRELLEQFGEALDKIDREPGEATKWTRAEKLNPFDQSDALRVAANAAAAAKAVADAAERLAGLGVTVPAADANFRELVDQIAALTPFTSDNESVVGSALHSPSACVALIRSQALWAAMRDDLSAQIRSPEAVQSETLAELRQALAIDSCPATPFAVSQQREAVERIATEFAAGIRDLERITEPMHDGRGSPTSRVQIVAAAVQELGQLDSAALALLSTGLAEPTAAVAIASATKDAAALRNQRDAILAYAKPEALDGDPAEIEAVADTLDTTSWLGRFGAAYKAKTRQAARIMQTIGDRKGDAERLHEIAAFLRKVRTFEDQCRAKHLFPPIIWDGIDSDFQSLSAAVAAISSAAIKLAACDEMLVLNSWLALDHADRQRMVSACTRSIPLLDTINSQGIGSLSLAQLPAYCENRVAALRRVEAAAEAAGLQGSCPLHVDIGTVADRLAELHGVRDQFDNARASGAFAWVDSISADLTSLKCSLDEIAKLEAISGPIAIGTILRANKSPVRLLQEIAMEAPRLGSAICGWIDALRALRAEIGTDATVLAEATTWHGLATGLQAMSEDWNGANLAADLLKYLAALTQHGLHSFAAAAVGKSLPATRLADMFELLCVSEVLRLYLGSDGAELAQLGSISLEAARRSFRRLDKDLHKLEAASIVAKRLQDKAPLGIGSGKRSDYTEQRLLDHEINLKKPRTPLRDVVHRAGVALQALKPVWMMSPTSVAQFIRPGTLTFDLLIVDEASQMRPEYSLSCMLRADQLVVVGDANQLPPSDHFQMGGTPTDGDEDGVGVDENTESILDLANQRFSKKPRLKWHYRSQHESLIQFSNRNFYDRDLVVFPSPTTNDEDLLGVKCIYVPDLHTDTVYEASINQREAEVVVEHAYGLMLAHPERSIGIVAMNAKQTELIDSEFQRLALEDERVGRYIEAFPRGSVDEFFIKNLENVQGDERDIIIISTVYGPGKDGKVRQNFSLIAREAGWRRLNVLVTRAKMSCRLVTSLRPDDVKVTDNSPRGTIEFQRYLTYAHGGATYDDASGGEPDSDFEIFVADAIRGAGYEVIYQVGVNNFRIDLGVRHGSYPNGFIAGIECDGATYHSGLTIRDRDHIRQSVLEGLGWTIYRVWSTDWFANPARETAKLIAWLDEVRDRAIRSLSPAPRPAPVTRKPKAEPPTSAASDIVVGETRSEFKFAESAKGPSAEPARGPAITPPPSPSEGPKEPIGRKLRNLGAIEPYEAIRGSLYEIWMGDDFLGEVEVISRASANPKLYGDRVMTAHSEYEGRVHGTGERFVKDDLYAAMREVAKRAKALVDTN